jgi:hypothetical protein
MNSLHNLFNSRHRKSYRFLPNRKQSPQQLEHEQPRSVYRWSAHHLNLLPVSPTVLSEDAPIQTVAIIYICSQPGIFLQLSCNPAEKF